MRNRNSDIELVCNFGKPTKKNTQSREANINKALGSVCDSKKSSNITKCPEQ
jgi:hypothetical protein